MSKKDTQAYTREMAGAISAQVQTLPYAVEAEARLTPMLQEAQSRNLSSQAQSLLGLYSGLYGQATQMQRGAMMGDIQTLGMGGQMATMAYQQALPGYAQNLQSQMGQQASYELGLGTALSEQDARYAQQAARSAAAARGLTGNQGIALEVLGGYNLGQKRQQERRAYAMDVYGMGERAQTNAYNMFLTPAYGTSSMFGLPGLLGAAESGYAGLGPQFLTPESQYLANIRANRIQGENARYAAQQAKQGSIIGGLASGIGAAIGCWVARCVYGEDNPRWLVFREWVATEAPGWFRELYTSKGEAFAEYISDKPILKAVVRKAMDIVVDAKVSEANIVA